MKDTQAAAWFWLLSAFDQRAAPKGWRWSDVDLQANAVLNKKFHRELGAPIPKTRQSWKGSGHRGPISAGYWNPEYFPDENFNMVLRTAKHLYISEAMIQRVEAAKKYAARVGRQLGERESLGFLETEESLVFSPWHYTGLVGWLVDQYPEFSLDPDLREEIITCLWTSSCFGIDADRVSELRRAPDSLWVLPPSSGKQLNAMLMGA